MCVLNACVCCTLRKRGVDAGDCVHVLHAVEGGQEHAAACLRSSRELCGERAAPSPPPPPLAQVLSVVAQQLLTIQSALKACADKFWFEGRPIRLVPTCGVFITMWVQEVLGFRV